MPRMHTALAVLLLFCACPVHSTTCGSFTEAQCVMCTMDTSMVCKGMMPSADAVCGGRSMAECLSCTWMNGMCMASGTSTPGDPPMNMGPMPMGMYFKDGSNVHILFEWWDTSSDVVYAFSCLGLVLMAFVVQIAREPVNRMHKAVQTDELLSNLASPKWWGVVMLFFVHQGFAYFVMLAAMTFNVGVFLSVIAGLTLGWAAVPLVAVKMNGKQKEAPLEVPLGSHAINSQNVRFSAPDGGDSALLSQLV